MAILEEENGCSPSSSAAVNHVKDQLSKLDLGEEEEEEEEEEEGKQSEEVEVEENQLPQRMDSPNCSFYMKNGVCKFGMKCRFNHPMKSTNQAAKDVFEERSGQQECQFYMKTGTCKFGQACRYFHPQKKDGIAREPELNFLGLPIRAGEKECPFYMRTGSCKFATNCKFHHPDPEIAGGPVAVPVYSGACTFGSSSPAATQSPGTTWPSHGSSNVSSPLEASAAYMPYMLAPHSGIMSMTAWNGYPYLSYNQADAGAMPSPEWLPQSAMGGKPPNVGVFSPHLHQQQAQYAHYPERPGQPVCQFYLKTGDCKFKLACRYHHPKMGVPNSPIISFDLLGLPIKPDQPTCSYYNRFGICKFGPACRYNHPQTTYAQQAPSLATTSRIPQSLERSSNSSEDISKLAHENGEAATETPSIVKDN